ncbi:ras guanine nucleotide exchange factor domain-containing protein [Powellomyces hirtus]|nr:ras guanine nucleotide exchange factor domain-containing protein [Powellomyces hirtus]
MEDAKAFEAEESGSPRESTMARQSMAFAEGLKARVLDMPKTEGPTASTDSNGGGKRGSDSLTPGPELPAFWGRKTTPQGDVYYYNTQTNQTTYSLNEVQSAAVTQKRSTILLMDASKDIGNLKDVDDAEAPPRHDSIDHMFEFPQKFDSPRPIRGRTASNSSASSWIPGPQSLLNPNAKPTWEVLINNILRAISELNHSAKHDSKAQYVALANQVVRAIRDMLGSSGLSSKNAPVMQNNKQLRSHHHQIMSALSKLILAAKVSAGLWPPPDAVNKMRYQAGQVLLAIRHFVSIAQDIPLELKLVSPGSVTDVSLSVDEFDQKGVELTDIEFAARLDTHSDSIIASIAKLVNVITQDRRISGVLIDQARVTVTEIGQLLSLIEEIPLHNMESGHNDARANELLSAYRSKKEMLYSVVNDLVTAARTTMDDFAPPNALGELLEVTTSVLQAVEDVLMVTKLVIDQKDLMEQRTLQEEAESYDEERRRDSELSILQRRAMSLTFLHGEAGAGGGLTPDSHMGRDRTVSTPIMLRSNSSTNVPYTPAPSTSMISSQVPQRRPSVESALGSSTHLSGSAGSLGSDSGLYDGVTRSASRNASGENLPSGGKHGGAASSKLAKFFGEESPKLKRASTEGNKKSWYLGHDYRPDAISFNMEGQVNGGTPAALVERLTLHDHPVDPVLFTAFMMLFHQFLQPNDFLCLLIKRFLMSAPPHLSAEELKAWQEKKQTPARLRVYNALRSWLENYWVEELDDPVLDTIQAFATKEMMEATPQLAMRLAELVQRKMHASHARESFGTNNSMVGSGSNSDTMYPPPILPKSLKKATVIDIDPLELARQLTLIESKLFSSIQPSELVGQEWTKKNEKNLAVNVRAMTKLANDITGWVAGSILAETEIKRRTALLKHYIKVGERCLQLQNFNTLMAILSALNSSTIIRLKKTWEALSSKHRMTFEALRKAADHSRNYADYRANLKRVQGPCLPFLGVYLTDLTFTEDGNPPTRSSPNGPLINIDKYIKICRIIQEVQRFQSPYMLTEVPELRNWLEREMLQAAQKGVNELYRISLVVEPRENEVEEAQREMEAKIKMLEKAGFL